MCFLSKSTFAKTRKSPASFELLIQHLVPSITQDLLCSSHVALIEKTVSVAYLGEGAEHAKW